MTTDARLSRAAGLRCEIAADEVLDMLRGQLAIGLHRHVEVTDGNGRRVSQAYCSALPGAYSTLQADYWESFARLVLQASYEATLLAAVEQADSGGSNKVLRTRLGGGAFGNDPDWIDSAIERALGVVADAGPDISIVCYGRADREVEALVDRYGKAE
ncbi:MAG: hypothetical protein O2892_13420 [Actinomycetota bacterium]|nr:hypothetical protein [Actinomycetota bacterium]MDA2950017.1 hypothetical protein [Actinomycetota bacterium]